MITFNFFGIHFCFLTCCILLLVVQPSNSENVNYTACSIPYSCGDIRNVGYPFWGENRPRFCGIPDYKLTCYDNYNISTFKVFQNAHLELRVQSINTSSHTITFSLDNMLRACYSQNTGSITRLPSLHPIPVYTKIQLFYGCSTDCVSMYNNSKSFKCSADKGGNGIAYYFDTESGLSRTTGNESTLSCSCSNNISVPVDKKGLDELKSTNASLRSILTKQLIVNKYVVNFTTTCSNCEKSGGRCGSSGDQFVCYNRDGLPSLEQPNSSPEPQLRTKKHGGRRKLLTILGSGISALVLGATMLVVLIYRAHKRDSTKKFSFLWSKRVVGDQNVAVFLKNFGALAPARYTYAEIRRMTMSFKDKLGEGGYGSVYKGKLNDGRYVAGKKLKILKDDDAKDLVNEVVSISRTNHVNVVTLLGFCFEGNKRALVFEFLPNGSLEKFIYGTEIGHKLEWKTMFNIAIGIARGLDYLHRGCNTRILHFDIKPHNILLDEEFIPKISDFGLARLCLPKNSMISMSVARGTVGYIAPEVFCRNFGGVSHKSDVYSYGMMLLDLVCGRLDTTNKDLCSSEQYFPEWIYNRLEALQDVAVHGIMDDDDDDGKQELERKMILVSLWCIQTYPLNRPPMFRVVEMLEGPLEAIQMPPMPKLSSPINLCSNSGL